MADLKETFPFLLVMEYMQESLLLLKRKWCWDITDILFLQKNVFKYQSEFQFSTAMIFQCYTDKACRFLLYFKFFLKRASVKNLNFQETVLEHFS